MASKKEAIDKEYLQTQFENFWAQTKNINTNRIQNGSITSDKIKNGSVTMAKLGSDVSFDIKTKLSEMEDDSTHRTVTDTEKETWNNKSTFSGSFADLTNKPTTLSGYGITDAVKASLVGANDGLAELGSDGKVPASQLPSYVDDVIEYENTDGFPTTGESGKIYIDTTTNKTYRWSGSQYVEISESLALGETASTAYAGNKGKALADNLSSHISNETIHLDEDDIKAIDYSITDDDINNWLDNVDGGTESDYEVTEDDIATWFDTAESTTVAEYYISKDEINSWFEEETS